MTIKDSVIKELVILLIEGDLDRAMAGNLKSFRVRMNNINEYIAKNPPTKEGFYRIPEKDVDDPDLASLSHHSYQVLTYLMKLSSDRAHAAVKTYIRMVVEGAGTTGDPIGIEIAHARVAEEIYEFLNNQRSREHLYRAKKPDQ